MTEDRKTTRDSISDGIRQGLGMLSALKDALEETIEEARERGDLSQERAKEIVKTAMGRAQAAAGEARERFDFVSQRDFDRLAEKVDELKVRLENLERRGGPAASAEASAGPDGGETPGASTP